MRDLFLPFRLRTYDMFDVVWEQRKDVMSQYKAVCAECGTEFPAMKRRSMFVIVPEGSERKRKPFVFLCACPNCLAAIREKLEKKFKRFSESSRIYYIYEIERALREIELKFVTPE